MLHLDRAPRARLAPDALLRTVPHSPGPGGAWDLDLRNATLTLTAAEAGPPATVVALERWPRWFHPDDAPGVRRAIRALRSGRAASVSLEFRVRGMAGDWIWIATAARATERCADGGRVRAIGGAFSDVTARRAAEVALRRRDVILRAVTESAELMLSDYDARTAIDRALARLGTATGADRVYVFEVHPGEFEPHVVSQRFEWAAPGVEPQIDNPDLQNASFVRHGFVRWFGVLENDGVIQGPVRELPEIEWPTLLAQGIRSIVIVPVRVNGRWWGFLGFDVCSETRVWLPEEIDALRTAGSIVGGGIRRIETEEQLRALPPRHDLTGSHDRRGFLHLAEQQWEMAVRYDRELVLLIIRVDGSPRDGAPARHELGEETLRAIADLLPEKYRRSDVVARLGGGVFAVLAEAPEDILVDRFRATLAELNRRASGPDVALRVRVRRARAREVSLEQLLEEVLRVDNGGEYLDYTETNNDPGDRVVRVSVSTAVGAL
jgi:diguanylate cyclase (GGDEF)-like protein